MYSAGDKKGHTLQVHSGDRLHNFTSSYFFVNRIQTKNVMGSKKGKGKS